MKPTQRGEEGGEQYVGEAQKETTSPTYFLSGEKGLLSYHPTLGKKRGRKEGEVIDSMTRL